MSKVENELKQPLPKGGNQKYPIDQNKLIEQSKLIDQNRLIQNYLREQPNGATNHHSNGDASSHHSNGDASSHHSNGDASNHHSNGDASSHHSNGDASSHHSNGDASSHHSNSGATNQDDHHVQLNSSCNNRGTNRVVKICEIFHKYSKHNDPKSHNTTKRLIDLLIQICVVG